jgi:glycosyltransferase involved in cell wall biosynthesis
MKPSLTCVIPAHNEGDGICETILEIDFYAPKNMDFVIFVSEDGSRDNTRDEVLRAATLVKNSKVILAAPADRLGYSKAVQRGILECQTDLICFMDADGQCDPQDIEKLITNALNKNCIVVGYRNPRVDGFNRIAYSKLFGFAFRLLGGPKRIDPSSPFVLATTDEIRSIGTLNFHLSFGFWWEFQWRIQALGLTVIQIPVNHRLRSAGITQVYTLKRLPRIIRTHLMGLIALRRELLEIEKGK